MKKTYTLLIYLFSLLAFGFIPFHVSAQDDPIECNYTNVSCLSVGYVNIELVEGNPDRYFISVDYQIRQGGEADCPAVRRLRFEPSFGNTGIINIGDGEEIIGSAVVQVNARNFEAQDRTLTLTVEYEEPGLGNDPIEITLPPDAECGEITPLPVELSRFDGKATQSGISLEWETASERDNSHFEVERSADGKSFAQLGSVPGNGNSSVSLSYKYLDRHPFPGLNYYRLKQVDYDGKYEFSKVVAVSTSENGRPLQAQMLPNPCFNGDCQLNIATATPGQPIRVQLLDLTGRIVFEQTLRDDGEQLQLSEQLKNLRGVFILSAEAGQEMVRQRVVLQ